MQRLTERRQRRHENVLEHIADHQHRQGVRNEEDRTEPVFERDFRIQQHRKEHAKKIRADRNQNCDENSKQVRVTNARILEHRNVILQSDEFEITVTLRIGERVCRALQERPIQEDGHQNHSRNGHPIKCRINLALGIFRNLILGSFCRFLRSICSMCGSHVRSSSHLKFLASILSYSDCMLFRNFSVLPD